MSGHLRVQGLRRTFAGASAPVLDEVDLEVPPAGCVALLGPSGGGKSTLLRLVAGLDTPDAGSVEIDGRDMTGVPPERRGTAMVFQGSRLFPHLSVRDNVAFPLVVASRPRRAARRDADRFLDLVGAAELADRRPSSLSGGQSQRVALARALAAEPDVLLLDEPFSALDPSVRSDMHRLLAELRAVVEPTLLLVTHDRQEAAVVADTVAVLLDGRIAQHDTVDNLYGRPASREVNSFLGGRNEVAGRLVAGVHISPLGELAVPASRGTPDGPAVLVVRQEAVRLVAGTDPAADVRGTVGRVGPQGARTLVEVTTAVGAMYVESAPGERWPPRTAVGLVLPMRQRWVLPVSTEPLLPEVRRPAESAVTALVDFDQGEQPA